MKKINLLPLVSLLILACSYTILIPTTPTSLAPAASSTNSENASATLTPSITPTLPTPTFTSTPTFIYSGPTPTSSATPLPTGTVGLLVATRTAAATVSAQLHLTSESPVFDSVIISGSQLVWGASCQANSIKVTAHIASGYNIASVLLFTRLNDQTTDTTTDWNNGAIMDTDGKGTFTYNLSATVIKFYKDFTSAIVQYQIVATNAKHQVVGRTQPYLNSITIGQCP